MPPSTIYKDSCVSLCVIRVQLMHPLYGLTPLLAGPLNCLDPLPTCTHAAFTTALAGRTLSVPEREGALSAAFWRAAARWTPLA